MTINFKDILGTCRKNKQLGRSVPFYVLYDNCFSLYGYLEKYKKQEN